MVEHIEHALREEKVALEVYSLKQLAHLVRRAYVALFARNEHILVEHHLSSTPQSLCYLRCLTLVALGYRYEGEVVCCALHGHIEVAHLGLHDKTYGGEEYALRSLCNVGIFHGGNTHNSSGVDSIAARCDCSNVETWVEVGERVESCVVTEWTLHSEWLCSVNIALKHKVAVGRHPYIVCQALNHLDGLLAQHACKQHLIHIVGHGCSSGVGVYGVAAYSHADGHTLAHALVAIVVARTCLMAMPVHASGLIVENLHTVHTHVGCASIGVDCAYHGQCYKCAAIRGPRGEDRYLREVYIVALPHNLLTLTARCALSRKPLRHVCQEWQHAELIHHRTLGCHNALE